MVRNNKTCILCGTRYTYCNNCAEFSHLPIWMLCYCSKNCKDIFDTLSSYSMKHITKEEAKNILNKCDLTNIDKFNKSNQNCIKEILKKDTAIPAEPVVESTPQEIPTKEFMNAPVEDVPVIKTEASVLAETPIVESETAPAEALETIADPVMGNTAIKQSKRMKYTKKK